MKLQAASKDQTTKYSQLVDAILSNHTMFQNCRFTARCAMVEALAIQDGFTIYPDMVDKKIDNV